QPKTSAGSPRSCAAPAKRTAGTRAASASLADHQFGVHARHEVARHVAEELVTTTCEMDPQMPRGSRTGAVKGGDGERAQGALVHRQSVEAKWEARARAHDDQFMGVRSVVSDVEQDVSGRYVIRRDGDVEIALGYAHDRCRASCRSRARGTGT